MHVSQQVSRFVSDGRFEALPEPVVAKAKQHIMDTLGVLIAAVHDPIAEVVMRFLEEAGGKGTCSVLGTGMKASPTHAALANGILAHGLDYDDTSWRLIGHPSAVVLPAVMAVGELRQSPGKDVITAYVLGTEVSCKLGAAAEPQLYAAGWHATGAVGVLGATAASGYLLGLTGDQLTHALGIAASLAGGLRENFGSMTKPFHAGAAAQHGVTAACLAKHGFTSSVASLDGKWGFYRAFTSGEKVGEFPSPGNPFDVEDPGFFVKPYPSCAATHTAIDGLLALVRQHGFNGEEVVSVEIGSGPVGPLMLIHNRPNTGYEGKFSMPFVAAMAITEGRVGIDSFADEKVRDARVRRLMEKVRLYVEPTLANCGIDQAPALVRVVLADGRELVTRVEEAAGSPAHPMSRERLIEKYKDCTSRVLPGAKVENSVSVLADLENTRGLHVLINELVPLHGTGSID